jgi:hypothetical protein
MHAVANNCGNFLVGESEAGVDRALSSKIELLKRGGWLR